MKRLPIKRKLKAMKKLIILKSHIDDKIDDHFESEGVYDYLENGKTTFEVEFDFQGYHFIIPYDIETPGIYKKEWVGATDTEKNDYYTEDGDLIISNKNYNPGKPTLAQRINETIDHQKKVDEENNFSYDWENGQIL